MVMRCGGEQLHGGIESERTRRVAVEAIEVHATCYAPVAETRAGAVGALMSAGCNGAVRKTETGRPSRMFAGDRPSGARRLRVRRPRPVAVPKRQAGILSCPASSGKQKHNCEGGGEYLSFRLSMATAVECLRMSCIFPSGRLRRIPTSQGHSGHFTIVYNPAFAIRRSRLRAFIGVL